MNSKIMAGKPVIKGTRIPVYLISELLASGMTEGEVIQEYSELKCRYQSGTDICASKIVSEEEV